MEGFVALIRREEKDLTARFPGRISESAIARGMWCCDSASGREYPSVLMRFPSRAVAIVHEGM